MKKLFFILLCIVSFQMLAAQEIKPSGEVHAIAILVEFKDLTFSTENPQEAVRERLDKTSAYFRDNSAGRFVPSFDLFGPVQLDKKVSAYGKDMMDAGVRVGDQAPELMLAEACAGLDGEVDFSSYDADGDGVLDLVILVFAGYDQAEGGMSDTLWSLEWDFRRGASAETAEISFDGKVPGHFIAVSELRGKSGADAAGIGPLCHEMGHFLGLPDFYDTNAAIGGNAGGVYSFSLMGNGLYNDGGNTPPYLNALERRMLGWWEGEIPMLKEGENILGPVQNGFAGMSATSVEGEFFLYEYRDGSGWDSTLPAGLMIYHVDQSARLIGEDSAAWLWSNWREKNALNATAGHPCFYAVPSSDASALSFSASMVPGNIVYPGLGQVIFYDPFDWDGAYTDIQISNIGLEEDGAHIFVLKDAGKNINGRVKDTQGHPLSGISLQLDGVPGANFLSGADGFFRLDIPEETADKIYSLIASGDGFRPQSVEVALEDRRMISVPVQMRHEGQANDFSLSKYDRHAKMGYFSVPSVIAAVRFTADDLAPYVGQQIKEISFYPYLTQAFEGEVFVTVDSGQERVLTQAVESLGKGPYSRNSVDISGANLLIPEGKDIYIGYGSPQPGDGSFYVGTVYPAKKGNSFYTAFSKEKSKWEDLYVKRAGLYMDVALSATVSEKTDAESLADLGYHYIDATKLNYKAGESFPLKLRESAASPVESVSWYLDDTPVSGDSVVLNDAGNYVIKANLRYRDGREEVLQVVVKVN